MSRQAVHKAASYVAINLMFKRSAAGSHITQSLGENRNPLELKHLNMTRSVLFERLPGLFLPHYQQAVSKLASEEEPVAVSLIAPRRDCPGRGVGYELRGCPELYDIIEKLKIDFQPLLEDLEGYELWYEPYDEEIIAASVKKFLRSLPTGKIRGFLELQEYRGGWCRDIIIKKCTGSPCSCFELSELQRALPHGYQKRVLTATGIELTEFCDIEPANQGRILSQTFYRFLLQPFRGREKEGPTDVFSALSALPIDTPIPRSPSIITSAGGQLRELIRVVGGRTREEHKF